MLQKSLYVGRQERPISKVTSADLYGRLSDGFNSAWYRFIPLRALDPTVHYAGAHNTHGLTFVC